MVACDQCQQWEHFTCAGVTQAIQRRPYLCKQCREAPLRVLRSHSKGYQSTKTSEGKPSTTSEAKGSVYRGGKAPSASIRSSSSITSSVRKQLELAEEEAKLREQELKEEEELQQRELEEAHLQLEEKRKLMNEEVRLRQLKLEADKTHLLK